MALGGVQRLGRCAVRGMGFRLRPDDLMMLLRYQCRLFGADRGKVHPGGTPAESVPRTFHPNSERCSGEVFACVPVFSPGARGGVGFPSPLARGKVSEDNKIMGVVTEGNLMACLLSGRVQPEDVVTSAMYKQFKKVREARLFHWSTGCVLETKERARGSFVTGWSTVKAPRFVW